MFSTPSRERVNNEYAKCIGLVGGVGGGGGVSGGGVKVNYGQCECGQYLRDLVFTESHAITNVY